MGSRQQVHHWTKAPWSDVRQTKHHLNAMAVYVGSEASGMYRLPTVMFVVGSMKKVQR